ncbi:hypothetical protein [Mesorhizobium sp.]|uniref:hypothetical protein n=1 Tax=Mesorhizobium sp. TaxID=1871066 RepID=UPI0011FED11E|nr:hypothetical protein [Mesorhizobium sp.]TIL42788.1 MAG: hypothetical protein E5Y86_25645 [Mesorhizobium sp.]
MEVIVTTTVVAVLAYTLSLFLPHSYADAILKALAAAAAGATFLLSYAQWRLARHEVSFDKYYDRIDIVNQAISNSQLKEELGDAGYRDHLRNMRVFAQLDNLEYILGKYKLNFVELDLVDRAVQTFRSDCYLDRSPDIGWFSDKVLFWIGDDEGRQIALGYHAHTRKAARYIVSRVSEQMDHADVQKNSPMGISRKDHSSAILAARGITARNSTG